MTPFLAQVIELLDAGHSATAITIVEERLASIPGDPGALIAMGHLAFLSSDFILALQAFREAHEQAPDSALAAEALAILFALSGELAEATYYAKLSQANGLNDSVLALFPAGWPRFTAVFRTIRERPFLARGMTALVRGDIDEALKNLRVQAAFSPDDGSTQRALADAELAFGHPRAAADILSRFAVNGSADGWDLSRLALALACAGEAQAAEGVMAEALATRTIGAEADLAATGLVTLLLSPATPVEGVALGTAVSRINHDLCGAPPIVGRAVTHDGLQRIGILASALSHPRDIETIAALGQGLREVGGPELVVFGTGSLSAPVNRLLQGRITRHIDAGEFDGDTLAYTIASENLDLLLDAGGIGAAQHMAALAQHPAGLTAAWLNAAFAGHTPGLDLLVGGNALDAGQVSMPLALCETGLVARLDRSARLDTGGHETPLLGADILPGQLHDDLLAAWASILHRLPQSRLLLRDREMSHPDTVSFLIARAQSLGIAERIEIVSGKDTDFAADLDLLLTPFVATNGHDVVTAAAVATPAVALAGPVRHRRFSAAALVSLGLGAHVATTVDDYVGLATNLATDGEARQRTAQAAAQAAAFSPRIFAQGLLAAIDGAIR